MITETNIITNTDINSDTNYKTTSTNNGTKTSNSITNRNNSNTNTDPQTATISTNNSNTDPQTTMNTNNHLDKETQPNMDHDQNTDIPDKINIPPHLITTFQILYRLKTKLSKLETTLEKLQEHKRTRTLPTGLQIRKQNKFYMEKHLRERWENTLMDASLALLDITITHHEHDIQDTKNKIQHKIAQIRLKCDATTAEQIIRKNGTGTH